MQENAFIIKFYVLFYILLLLFDKRSLKSKYASDSDKVCFVSQVQNFLIDFHGHHVNLFVRGLIELHTHLLIT